MSKNDRMSALFRTRRRPAIVRTRILSRTTIALMTSDHLGTRIAAPLTPGELLLGTPGYATEADDARSPLQACFNGSLSHKERRILTETCNGQSTYKAMGTVINQDALQGSTRPGPEPGPRR